MVALDILKFGYDQLFNKKDQPKTAGDQSIFGKIMESVGGSKNNPEIASQAQEKKELFQNARESIFGEIGKSLLLRQMPRLSALTDLGLQASGNKAAEKVAWQNEFETITALLILVPNSWKHHLTDLFARNSVFQTLVRYWPGLDGVDLPIIGSSEFLSKELPGLGQGGSLRARILDQNPPDPDAVIQFLRVVHQDIFVTGKTSFDKLKELIGGTGALATLAGGGALAAGAEAFLGKKTPGSSNGIVDQIQKAVGLDSNNNIGKKIIDLANANPSAEKTTMQKNLLSLLEALKIKDTATLKQGSWEGNNDQVTVEFYHNNHLYYLIFDNDSASTDLKVNNAQGLEIANLTDWGDLDTEDSAKTIFTALESKSAAPQTTPSDPIKASSNPSQIK